MLGGLKTKNIDVVVSAQDVGPCLAISVKGSLNAFRNLTNRIEEAVGDCTNIHIAYPTLVYGFMHVIKGNRHDEVSSANDVAIPENGEASSAIQRYYDVMERLTGRSDVRNDASKYESVAIALVGIRNPNRAGVLESYPASTSKLRFEAFFDTLCANYDQRFVYAAPAMER